MFNDIMALLLIALFSGLTLWAAVLLKGVCMDLYVTRKMSPETMTRKHLKNLFAEYAFATFCGVTVTSIVMGAAL